MTAPGTLWLVGTPIGNLGDMPPAGRARLGAVDIVAAEDTRRTRKLLSAFALSPPRLVSIRAENEERSVALVLRWLAEGRDVALVTDAGMPGISDPGARLVRGVLDGGGAVRVEPGPDAASAAVLVSGFAVERWCFDGFVPRRGPKRRAWLQGLGDEARAVVVYESPHRLLATLDDLAATLPPDRHVAVANDLTKLFARVTRGPAADVRAALGDDDPRGEIALVIAPKTDA
ncbi:MAG TPA: 16S rRNA (cytidine(1402)-2'-O)-methyltransferase [Iamia sp.]